jgi:hypothetical protein
MLEFEFEPSVDLAAGFSTAAGNTKEQIVIEFDYGLFTNDDFDFDVSISETNEKNYDKTDCPGLQNMTGQSCFVARGSATSKMYPKLVIGGHAAVTSSQTTAIMFPGFGNPVKGKIISGRLFVRKWTGTAWHYTQFNEIRYIYMTKESTLNTITPTGITYSSTYVQTDSTLTFDAALGHTLV